MPEATVCLVDDDPAVLESLGLLLEIEGYRVRRFQSALALLDAGPGPVACIVSDVRMPGMDGLEMLRRLRDRLDRPPVIMITGHGDVPMAVRAMQLGAADFLEKPFEPDRLLRIVRRTVESQALPLVDADAGHRLASLTPREDEVFEELITGHSNKEIARALGISPRTVEIHRARVMEKMAAGSLAELVRLAIALGRDPATRHLPAP